MFNFNISICVPDVKLGEIGNELSTVRLKNIPKPNYFMFHLEETK